MKKNKLTICLSLLAVTASLFALLCSQFGCKKSENTDKTERPTVTVTLSPERVSVAEYESVRLVAEVEGSDETVYGVRATFSLLRSITTASFTA